MRAAELVRKELNLTEKEPIRDIAGLLEANGTKLYPISLASDGFFGLCIWHNKSTEIGRLKVHKLAAL